MKLYYYPGAASLAVHIALREVDADFYLERVNLPKKQLENGSDYLKISQQGSVPVLEFWDGSRHTETAALLQWIAECDASLRLIGGVGSERRMDVLRWLTFVATELHKSFSPWLWREDIAQSSQDLMRDTLKKRFAEVEAVLMGRKFLAHTFSVADAYAFTVLSWALVLEIPLDDYPAIRAYLRRVSQRPAVEKALFDEGLQY